MNISQLIQSTSRVKGYDAKNTFGNKKFGEIYAFNKLVRTKPNSSIIEVSMMIKGVSDKVKSAKGEERSVAAHKVMVAIRGVEQRTVTLETLLLEIRKVRREYEDKEAYPNETLIELVLGGSFKPFEGKTIMPQANGTFTIITDKISKESEIRVWCSCSSYYWVFMYYNIENGVDIWNKPPKPYKPKTEAGFKALQENRPMRNPGRHPGMCKHIMLLLALLMEEEVVNEARGIARVYRANIERFLKKDRISESEYASLMKKYASDHRRKLKQRAAEYSEVAGYADLKGIKTTKKSWNGNPRSFEASQKWRRVQNNNVGRKKK